MDLISDQKAAYGIKQLFKSLNQRPIAYYPIYREITGSTTSGILLSQLMYWYGKIEGDTFYKTDRQIKEETMLTENELRAAKANIKKLNIVTITLRGVPAKTNYTVNIDVINDLIYQTSLVKSTNTVSLIPLNCDSEIHETITEITTEITTEIKKAPNLKPHDLESQEKSNFLIKGKNPQDVGPRPNNKLTTNDIVDRLRGICSEKLNRSVASMEFSAFSKAYGIVENFLDEGGDPDELIKNYSHFLCLKDKWLNGKRFELMAKHYIAVNSARVDGRLYLNERDVEVERPKVLDAIF